MTVDGKRCVSLLTQNNVAADNHRLLYVMRNNEYALGRKTVLPSTRVHIHSMVGIGKPRASHDMAILLPVRFFMLSGGVMMTGAECGETGNVKSLEGRVTTTGDEGEKRQCQVT